MSGAFLLGTLSRSASENGAIVGMLGGLAANILLWKQPHSLTVMMENISFPFPKIAWTWFLLIGSLITFVPGWTASKILPQANHQESPRR